MQMVKMHEYRTEKNTILDIFFGRDKFDRIGQSAAFTALFNKLVHYFTLLVLSRVGTCRLLGGGDKETPTSKLIIECPAIRIYQTLVCRGGTKKYFFLGWVRSCQMLARDSLFDQALD